jgi:hypothetical protein
VHGPGNRRSVAGRSAFRPGTLLRKLQIQGHAAPAPQLLAGSRVLPDDLALGVSGDITSAGTEPPPVTRTVPWSAGVRARRPSADGDAWASPIVIATPAVRVRPRSGPRPAGRGRRETARRRRGPNRRAARRAAVPWVHSETRGPSARSLGYPNNFQENRPDPRAEGLTGTPIPPPRCRSNRRW